MKKKMGEKKMVGTSPYRVPFGHPVAQGGKV